MSRTKTILNLTLLMFSSLSSVAQLELVHTIKGGITPKSVVYNHEGLFFAQNMIYGHSVSVFDENYVLVKTIRDRVNLSDYGHEGGSVKGGPVEVAFSHGGQYAWVSNYSMEGPGFEKPGCDNCSGEDYDPGYVYRIRTDNFSISKVIEVGSIPKFVAATPDDRLVLVSNWTSGTVSVIETATNKVVKTIDAGRFPRGIVVDHLSKYAYIAIMGSSKILRLNLHDYSESWILNVGRAPRHLCIGPEDRFLYATINYQGKIVKISLSTGHVVAEVATGRAPRSMEITPDGRYLYAVNYNSNSFSKVRTSDMAELEEMETELRPIGITLNWDQKEVWVACYSGFIQVFKDFSFEDDNPNLLASLDDNVQTMIAAENDKTETDPEPEPEPLKPVEPEVVIPEPDPEEVVENNFLPGTYIVVGSFSVNTNAENLANDLKRKGYEALTIPSKRKGFTCTAIVVQSNPTQELALAKQKIISDAWIYRP